MRKVDELFGKDLKWVQPRALKMHYELLQGEELAATLRFRSSFGTLATAESGDGCWTFKRVGFWQTRVTIRVCGEDTDIAVFKNNTWSGGGTLELADGRKYLASTNFWRGNYEFKTETGETLVKFKNSGLIHLSAEVETGESSRNVPEMKWVIMLGWYLTVMMYMDSAIIAAAT
jgi:hypothetical protein